jgi:hypothetical protein
MKVVVKKSALDQIVKQLAEERGYHSRRIDQIAGDDHPVLPDAQMATQLSTQRVPVEDPDFLPVNKLQLSKAASEIAREVSPGKIQGFYAGLKKLLRKSSEPKQYKGMSETDLMEALRPIIAKEAKLGMFVPDGDEDNDEKPETGFRAGPTYDAPGGPPKRKSVEAKKAAKVAGKIARAKAGEAPIVSIGGKKLDSTTIDELELMRQRWTAAPDLIAMRQIRDQVKVPLSTVIAGDASRLLDAFLKADLELPSTFDQAQIKISTETISNVVPKGFDLPTVVVRVKFEDLAQREKLKGKLLPIVHTGGPIEVYTVDQNGKEIDQIYYLLNNFPFSEQEYIDAFREAFQAERRKMHDQALADLTRKQRNAEDKEQEKVTDSEKKKRSATMQKSLSIGLAKTSAVSMREDDPKKLEKILGSLDPSMTLSDFDNLSEDEKDVVLSKVVAVLDKERGPYYEVGDMDYLRDIFSEESDDKYTVTDEGVFVSDPVALGVGKLSKEFFGSAIEPAMRDVVDTMLDNNPDIEIGIDDVLELFAFDSYENFIENVDDRAAFINFFNGVIKEVLTNNSDLFDEVMPDFAKIRKAVETKDEKTLSSFEGRFRLLGIEDKGRLRAIFQYLKTPVAFMKAIDVTTRLQEMSGKVDFADDISNPEKLKMIVAKQIATGIEKDPTRFFTDYRALLISNGIEGVSGLANTFSKDPKKIFDIVSPLMSARLKKGLSQRVQRNIDAKVEEAIDNFIMIMSPDFVDLSDISDPAAKPVLNYIKKFVTDMQMTAEDDPAFNKIAPKISATVDSLLKVKPKQGSKKK